jgi:hypothetical protein
MPQEIGHRRYDSSHHEFFDLHREVWEQFRSLEDLKSWVRINSERIDVNPAAWCAVELAIFDLWGARAWSIDGSLSEPPGIIWAILVFCCTGYLEF